LSHLAHTATRAQLPLRRHSGNALGCSSECRVHKYGRRRHIWPRRVRLRLKVRLRLSAPSIPLAMKGSQMTSRRALRRLSLTMALLSLPAPKPLPMNPVMISPGTSQIRWPLSSKRRLARNLKFSRNWKRKGRKPPRCRLGGFSGDGANSQMNRRPARKRS
jgi:hypothetical protein